MMADRKTLADLGHDILASFERAYNHQTNGYDASEQWPATSLLSEAERFQLWAVNLGLFVSAHGSLDYRLREARSLQHTISRFMKELGDSLTEIIQVESDKGDQTSVAVNEDGEEEGPSEEERSNTDSEYSSNASADLSNIDIVIEDVRDIIDRLYKVSTKIRNTSSRNGWSRAARHKQLDPETGVDFLKAIQTSDQDHVRSLFLEYQKLRALQEHAVTASPRGDDGDSDLIWEPIRTVLSNNRVSGNSFLIDRIAEANTLRRQQFAYWRNHREKLILHARASISTQAPLLPTADLSYRPTMERNPSSSSGTGLQEMLKPTAPSVTTATHLNSSRPEVISAKSIISVSEYEPSVWQPARDVVEFPPPPKDRDGDQFFECPYCFTICPRGSDKAWKAHLIHDLRPHVCTYEHCNTAGQLYESRHDWIHHENTNHRKIWRCLEHSDQAFAELTTYKLHLETERALQIDSPSMNGIIRASESTSTATDRACPVCSVVLDTPRALHSHIALHLERFSLFSLPRSTGAESEDQDEASGSESDQAHGVIAGSREDDLDGDLDYDSENDADEKLNQGTPAHPSDQVEPLDLDSNPGLGMKGMITVLLPAVAEGQAKAHTPEPEPGPANNNVVPNVENSTDQDSEHITVVGTVTHVIEDHNTPVYAVCFSPDDRLLASVSDDKVVRIWNLEMQTAFTSLEGHRTGFRSLAWSSGALLRTLKGHGRVVYALAFSPDSSILTSGSNDWTIKVWDLHHSGRLLRTLEGHEKGVTALAFSPDGLLLASGSYDHTIRVWDCIQWQVVGLLRGHTADVYAVAFSHHGTRLVSGSRDRTVRIWYIERNSNRLTDKRYTSRNAE